VLIGFFVGCLFAALGRYSANVVAAGHWLYTPLVFMTIFIGLRPDDWFIPAYISGVFQVVLLTVLMRIFFQRLIQYRAGIS
jgi:hypothetical protein